ncbi:KCNV2 protein, partial [Columbina picui]|nr:KCNV2 protein [Columbina picui]
LLNINVGGKLFHIACKVAARYPVTRLGKLALHTDPMKKLQLCDDYSVQKNEYFFDRDPSIFHYIFHFYRSGVLWIMDEMCPSNFVEEIEYWGIHLKYSQRCCRILFEEKQDELSEYLKIQKELEAELEPLDSAGQFEGKFLGRFRKMIWNLTENPYSSVPAKIIAVMSSFFVLISIVGMTLSTVEEMKHKTGKMWMEQLEMICAIFFTSEYLMRLISSSSFKNFLRAAFNAVDLVAILPFYVQILFENLDEADTLYHEELHQVENVSKLGKFLMAMLRQVLFFRRTLTPGDTGSCNRQGGGPSTADRVCRVCSRQVSSFSLLSQVSLSTVGYGDTVPDTVLGRIVAFGCISFGIILNGMPISILYNKFSDYYAKLKAHENET